MWCSCVFRVTENGITFSRVAPAGLELRKGRGGGGVTKARPLTLLYTTLIDRKVPLSYTSYWRVPYLQLCISFNCRKCTVLKITKPERFLDFFTAIKCICLPFRAFLPTEMTDFPTLSHTLTTKNPYPFIYLKPEKGTPFGRSLSV